MADDSLEVREEFDFHSCNVPFGIEPFIFEDLTEEQQRRLNLLRVDTIREDEKYLASHPEVRGIVSLILRRVFRVRPQRDIIQFIARYFLQPAEDISDEVERVILPQRFRKCEGDSAVKIRHPDVIHNEEERERFLEPPEIPTRVTNVVVCSSRPIEVLEDVEFIVARVIEEILTRVEIMLNLPVDVIYATHASDDILSDFNYRGRFDTTLPEPAMEFQFESGARSISQAHIFSRPPEELDYIIEHVTEQEEYGVTVPDEEEHEPAELIPEEESFEKQREEDHVHDLKKLSEDGVESPLSVSAQGLLRGYAKQETEPQDYDPMKLSEEKLKSEELIPIEEPLVEEDKDREAVEFIETTSQTSLKEDIEKAVSREEILENKESTDLVPDVQAESADVPDVPDDSEDQNAKTESTFSLEKRTSSTKKKLKKSSSSKVKKRSGSKLKRRSGGSMLKEEEQDLQEESPEEPISELYPQGEMQRTESAEDTQNETILIGTEDPHGGRVDTQDEDAEALKIKETIFKEEQPVSLSEDIRNSSHHKHEQTTNEDDKGGYHESEHLKASHAVSFSDRKDIIEVDLNEFVVVSPNEEGQDISENKGNEISAE